MFFEYLILLIAIAYIGVLFAIAYYGDKRADEGRSLISNPYIYSLSLAVYCTSWTFYGSVGRAASAGVGFLPIYLGPTLMAALWGIILRKIIRISKTHRITSIADFISSRYGKSPAIGGLVTIIAVIGVTPYIALQLKAVSTTFDILIRYPASISPAAIVDNRLLDDTALYVALLMAIFAILFGTRHLDASERHEGLVAAIAFESVVKLLAFLLVGMYITYGVYNGFGHVFDLAAKNESLAKMLTIESSGLQYLDWAWLIFLSMMAIMFLPRQFQVAVVENSDENHIYKAIWMLPLYLLAINIFVLPIAFGGLMHFPNNIVDADTFVLTIPLAEGQHSLAILVFLGGISAATGMVIVATVALSTMICNDLVMPILTRIHLFRISEQINPRNLLLTIRRSAIFIVLLMGYLTFRIIGESYPLVSIGLVSFAAVAQFTPAIIGGIYWKGATKHGAFAGLTAGFIIWFYTLLLPTYAHSGWLSDSFIQNGPFGLTFLKPFELFGLSGYNQITHSMFWSMLANLGCYIGFSLKGHRSGLEQSQASLFVDIFSRPQQSGPEAFWRGTATVADLQILLARFLGSRRADETLKNYAQRMHLDIEQLSSADAGLVAHVEKVLSGAIGASSARVMISSVVKEEPLRIDEVLDILDETSQAIAYSRELEQKSRELEAATEELRKANDRLQELDRLKDEFISTVTHELRTPLTAIRASSEILYDNPGIDEYKQQEFLGIIVRESERLTRLINQVLDLGKIESGKLDINLQPINFRDVISDSLSATRQSYIGRSIHVTNEIPDDLPDVFADYDRSIQIMVNLISNAFKFCDKENGRVTIRATCENNSKVRIDVIDNGPGIEPGQQSVIFEKFRQAGDTLTDKPHGSGLGLPITQKLIEHMGGRIWVESTVGEGSTFSFVLPMARSDIQNRNQ